MSHRHIETVLTEQTGARHLCIRGTVKVPEWPLLVSKCNIGRI